MTATTRKAAGTISATFYAVAGGLVTLIAGFLHAGHHGRHEAAQPRTSPGPADTRPQPPWQPAAPVEQYLAEVPLYAFATEDRDGDDTAAWLRSLPRVEPPLEPLPAPVMHIAPDVPHATIVESADPAAVPGDPAIRDPCSRIGDPATLLWSLRGGLTRAGAALLGEPEPEPATLTDMRAVDPHTADREFVRRAGHWPATSSARQFTDAVLEGKRSAVIARADRELFTAGLPA